MRYRILLADENHTRIAKQGFTRIIEHERVSDRELDGREVERLLRLSGELPEGYRVALVRELA